MIFLCQIHEIKISRERRRDRPRRVSIQCLDFCLKLFCRLGISGAALFRRITPSGTSLDGDIVFALCKPDGPKGMLMPIEINAVAALEEAIERAVRLAVGRDGIPGLADTK